MVVAAVFSTEIKFTSAGLEDAMAEKKLRFRTKIDGREAGGGGGDYSASGCAGMVRSTRARVPIPGTINGVRFRSSLMPMGGCHRMPLNQTPMPGAGVKAGDIVDVVMERDSEVRTVEAPPELNRELAKSKPAEARWG
jgi:hypothetical protein